MHYIEYKTIHLQVLQFNTNEMKPFVSAIWIDIITSYHVSICSLSAQTKVTIITIIVSIAGVRVMRYSSEQRGE